MNQQLLFRLCSGLQGAVVLMLAASIFSFSRAAEIAESSQRASQLADALASSNSPPEDKTPWVHLPANYDERVQSRISSATLDLLRLQEIAFPALVAHLGDSRYSLTHCGHESSAYLNYSVGKVCRRILRVQLEVYAKFARRTGGRGTTAPSYVNAQLGDETAAAEWMKLHGRKKLYELQIEALEWAIGQERKRGFADVEEESRILGPMIYLVKELTTRRAPMAAEELDWRFPRRPMN